VAARGQRAQDLRELVRCELASSTRAVAELREAAGGGGIDHARQPRPRPVAEAAAHVVHLTPTILAKH